MFKKRALKKQQDKCQHVWLRKYVGNKPYYECRRCKKRDWN